LAVDHVVGDGLSLGPILLQILHQVVELARLQELAHVIAGNRVHSDLKPTALHVRVHVILSKENIKFCREWSNHERLLISKSISHHLCQLSSIHRIKNLILQIFSLLPECGRYEHLRQRFPIHSCIHHLYLLVHALVLTLAACVAFKCV